MTGEAVALDLRPAALPSRCLAALLDGVLQLALLLLLFAGSYALGTGSDAADATVLVLVLVTATVVYPVGFETALRGRTPGKAALGLRTVRDDGGPIAFRHALVRGLSGSFLEKPGITFGFAALACSLLHPSGKRVGDLLAGTLVLQERVPSRGGTVAVMPPPLAGWAASLDLSGLTDDLALQARALLSRSSELSPQAREDLGGRLVAAVVARISPPPPGDAPGWAVLSAVLAERTRRAQERMGGEAALASSPAPAAPCRGDRPRGAPCCGAGDGSPHLGCCTCLVAPGAHRRRLRPARLTLRPDARDPVGSSTTTPAPQPARGTRLRRAAAEDPRACRPRTQTGPASPLRGDRAGRGVRCD